MKRVDMILSDGTQLIMAEGRRIVVRNKYVNYDRDCIYLFCEGDEEYLDKKFTQLINGEIKEKTVIGTTEPDLVFIIYPDGYMRIEIDMMNDGVFSSSWLTFLLDEEEAIKFAKQWVGV